MKNKTTYPAVDCFKFICCILIIAIHAKPFQNNFWLDAGVGLITRFAVPYFFVATGFFFFKSIEGKPVQDQASFLKKYELRMLRLYITWFILQNICNIIISKSCNSPFYYLRHFIWPNNGSILWFIPATMFAVFFVYQASRVTSMKRVLGFCIFIWLIGYCISTIAPVFSNILVVKDIIELCQTTFGIQNGLFFGLPYIALAWLFASRKLKKCVFRDVLGIAVCFCCLALEALVIILKVNPQLTFLWISSLPLTYFTFHLTLSLPIVEKHIYVVLRKISTLVYVIHPMVLAAIQAIFTKVGFSDFENLTLFIGVCLISIILSVLLYQLSSKKKYQVLKILM